MSILSLLKVKLSVAISAVVIGIGSLFGLAPEPVLPPVQPILEQLQQQREDLDRARLQQQILDLQAFVEDLKIQVAEKGALGASIPVTAASFETSLASDLTSSATSTTFVKGTNAAGNTLSGYMCFTIDANTTKQEYVCGTASGTALDSMIRGIDPTDGDLEVASLKKSHRIGARVVNTDFPVLGILGRILNGDETIPNALHYSFTTTSTINSNDDIPNKAYVDSLAIAGVSDANYTDFGGVILATSSQLAAGTATSTATRFLVAPSQLFGSTSSERVMVPVTNASGTLPAAFVSSSAITYRFNSGGLISASTTLNGSTTVKEIVFPDATTQITAFAAGSLNNVFSTTTATTNGVATGTWTAAAGTSRILAVLVGGGGGGGDGTDDSGGGGGGGLCMEYRTVTANATGTWQVGGGGETANDGTAGEPGSSSSLIIAGTTYIASEGSGGGSAAGGGGGAGAGSGCDINGQGVAGMESDAAGTADVGGAGGAGNWGFGKGGLGGLATSAGATGQTGIVIIFEYR